MGECYPYLDMFKDDGTGISVENWIDSWSVGMHRHRYCEMLLLERGALRHVYNDVRTLLIPGDLVIVGENREHGYLINGEISVYNCQFYTEKLDKEVIREISSVGLLENQTKIKDNQPFSEAITAVRRNMATEDLPNYMANSGKQGVIHLSPAEQNRFTDILQRMIEEQESGNPSRMLKQKYMEVILLELKKKVKHQDKVIRSNTNQSQNAVAQIIREMEMDMTRPFDIEETAKKYAFSPNYLRKIFKDFTGTTPIQYLNRIRSMRASEMIQEGADIKEAAEEVGFYDMSYFSRVFKKHIGYSPGRYAEKTNKS